MGERNFSFSLDDYYLNMDNNLNNNMNDIQSKTQVVSAPQSIGYGNASGISIGRPESSSNPVSLSLGDLASFYITEYFKGILFVLLSMAFIFAVPAFIVKPAKVKAMLGKSLKRTLDIIGSIVGLILTAPLWIIIPIIIKLNSPGPVFYTQLRVGLEKRKAGRRYHQKADVSERRGRDRRREDCLGNPFRVIKFRTMVHNAEKGTGPIWASKNDSRVTSIGTFLRKSRIDEIPQFINVLMGEMSLVGPRPERPNFVADLTGKVDGYADRLAVKPGLTGLAQVTSGYDSSIASVAEKVKYDLDYIENWSIWLDIKILLKTVVVVFSGRGAQ